MVLQGEGAGFSPPFDAPLYMGSLGRGKNANEEEVKYRDVESLFSFFTIGNDDIADILPEGIQPYGATPQGVVWITEYNFSTVGEYREMFSLIQVEDLNGEMAYYVPYIYVDGDAAMASGREIAGAPKKQAKIELDTTGSVMQGTLERPEGKRLVTLNLQPDKQVQDNPLLDAAMPDPIPLLSVRHLPPIEGDDGITQLVDWYARIRGQEDTLGDEKRWMGPGSLTYDSPSNIDPVHKLSVQKEMLTMYLKMDMELGVNSVQQEWRI